MGQGSLNGRAMLNINYDIVRRLDFILLIDAFGQKKAGKAFIIKARLYSYNYTSIIV